MRWFNCVTFGFAVVTATVISRKRAQSKFSELPRIHL